MYTFKNNVYGFSPELLAWFDSIDTLFAPVFISQRGQRFFDTYPKFTLENTLYEYVPFTDAPDPADKIPFALHQHAAPDPNVDSPDPSHDRNGVADLTVDPFSMGPAPDEYDFDYSFDHAAYTHARGGFPAGDLNWFPDKKAEWEDWVTDVEDEALRPTRFDLSQNYPNPFNPVTTIKYQIAKQGKVELTIHNMLGQKVRTLIDKAHSAGQYQVEWDARSDMGQKVSSGVYFYCLKTGDQIQTKKMLLMK